MIQAAKHMQQGRQRQRDRQWHQQDTSDEYSRDVAEEGDVAKDDHFATTGDFAVDGRLAFTSK
jgi:hypothetical protein